MITEGKSIVANDVKNLISNKNISFVVCEASMKRNNVERNQLLPGVETVPDGIYEIITKQGEGWGYIKVAH
jgi:intracellular sulfur oxidation DsrE/DsrF family protein